ncbi:MAG: hypothetical protein Q9191_005565 [Dirinaria sp. TL-2023a]
METETKSLPYAKLGSLTLRRKYLTTESSPVSRPFDSTLFFRVPNCRSNRVPWDLVAFLFFLNPLRKTGEGHPFIVLTELKRAHLWSEKKLADPQNAGEHIRHMFDYAHWRLKLERVFPRSLAFLKEYQNTAKKILDGPADETAQELKIKLAGWTKTLHSVVILQQEPASSERERATKPSEISRPFRYLADYGDYLGEQCKAFRNAAVEKKDKFYDVDEFCKGKTWQTVQDQLHIEEEQYQFWKSTKTGTIPRMPKTMANTTSMLGYLGKKSIRVCLKVLNSIRDRFFLRIEDSENPIFSEETNERLIKRTAQERARLAEERTASRSKSQEGKQKSSGQKIGKVKRRWPNEGKDLKNRNTRKMMRCVTLMVFLEALGIEWTAFEIVESAFMALLLAPGILFSQFDLFFDREGM